MKNLELIQQQFADHLFEDNSQKNCLDELISSNYAAERFNVYRQTIMENYRHALSITFPGVWKLLGEKCANETAYAFVQQKINLPKHGCLNHWGSEFPTFLAAVPILKKLTYVEDFAQYEWLVHLSNSAENSPFLKAENLNELLNVVSDKEEIPFIYFEFAPSFFLYFSVFPINEIKNMLDAPNSYSISLANMKEKGIVIVRSMEKVLTYEVDKALGIFLKDLKEGIDLNSAYEKVLEFYPTFDLTQALAFLVNKRLCSRVYIGHSACP